MSSEETFSINAAAKLTGYTVPTIRKRLEALSRAGAVQLEGGRWEIPLSALHYVGLMAKVEGEPVKPNTGKNIRVGTIDQIEALQVELADALRRAAVAEAVAAERQVALDRADLAMRVIEAKQAQPAAQAPIVVQAPASEPRRGWFSRR